MVSSRGAGGLEKPATAVSRGGGGGFGTPAMVAGSGGGGDSGNSATVARSGFGDRSVKPATVASGGDRSVKPATAASGGGDSGKSVTAASNGGSSGRAMLHGIEIPDGMDPAISFLLTIRMDTYQVALDGSMRRCSEFDYPLIVESSMNFNEVQQAMCNKYPWGMNDTVLIRYFDRDTNCYVDVKRDDDLALMFGKYQETRSVVIQLFAYFKTLLRTVVDHDTVNVIPQSLALVNVSDTHPPSAAGASQQNQRKVSSDANDILNDDCDGVFSDNGAHSEDEDSEDEDEKMYPDLARCDHDYIPAIYASTDDEEDQEDIHMGGFIDDEIEVDVDRPVVEYDKNNPSMEEGTVFPSVIDCRNALATFAIVKEFDYITEKSDPTRLRAHCAFEGCRWRIHASFMKNSKLFQIKVNPYKHRCPNALESGKLLAAKSRWVCDVVLEWVRKNPAISVSTLIEKIQEKYKITVPYMRVSNGREKALDKLLGKWADSFHLLYTFKAEVERCSPGSVVDIDRHTVQYKVKGVEKEKECFRRVFVSFKACWQGFKDGCRPYLAVDATALNGRFKGQLVAACAVDAHNWLFPVAYGVLETESTESWTWWLERLHQVVGHPEGLVIHTDACKGLETAVDSVFPGVEHRECMRHLATNFSKKFRGKIFDDNLWPASLTCSTRKHAYHLRQMYSKPKVQEYLETRHTKIWARSKFNEVCKIDYVNNNLAESFNSKLKKVKALQMVDMFDCLRQRSIFKFDLRRRIAEKLEGHRILPSVVKALHEKTRGLNLTCLKRNDYEAEVTGTDKEGRQWRYLVDIKNNTCSCRQWQITGLPCIHALKFITSLRGPRGDIESYVHDFYSVAKFKATYAEDLPAMVGKEQWEPFNPGFKLCAPLMKRPPGRPRTKRIRASSEGGRLGARKRKCGRCGGFGHIKRMCKEPVDPAFGEEGYEEPEQEPEPIVVASSSSSRKGAKKVVRKNTSNKRKSPDSTNVDASATGPVSLDSPAKNTRSKTTKAQDSPAKNTRNRKKLCL